MSSIRESQKAGKAVATQGTELSEMEAAKAGKKKSTQPQPSVDVGGSAPKLSSEGAQPTRGGKLPDRTKKATGAEGVLAAEATSMALVQMPKISAAAIQASTANYPMRKGYLDAMVAWRNQPLNLEQAANLKNTYSPNFYSPGTDARINAVKLRKTVPVSALRQWGEVKMTPEQFSRSMFATALVANLVPFGGMVINQIGYPTLSAYGPTGWPGVAARAGVALSAAVVTSAIQPFVVQFQESVRQRMAPSFVRPKEVTARMNTEQLVKAKKQQAAVVTKAAQDVAARLSVLSEKYEVEPPQNGASADEMFGALQTLHAKLDNAEKEELLNLFASHSAARDKLVDLKNQELGYDHLNEREKDARKDQRLIRALRSGAGTVSVFFKPLPEEPSWLDNIKTDSRWTAGEASALTAKIQVGAIFGQAPLAALDEWRHAVRDDIAMGLLYADIYNKKGKQDLRAGRPVGKDGIDPDKLEALFKGPHRSVVDRVATVLQARIDQLKREIAKLDKKGDKESVAVDLAKAQAELNEMEADLPKLKVKGHEVPQIMDLIQGGQAEQLLDSAIKPFALAFKVIDGKEKLRTKNWSDAFKQFGERMGQFAHGYGLTGTLGAMAGTSGLMAAFGGSAQASLVKQLGIQVGGAVFGYVTASLLYTASVVKAQARETDMGLGEQIWKTINEGFRNGLRLLLNQSGKSDKDVQLALREGEELMQAGLRYLMENEEQIEEEAVKMGEAVEFTEDEVHRLLELAVAAEEGGAGPSFAGDAARALGIEPEQQKPGSSSQG